MPKTLLVRRQRQRDAPRTPVLCVHVSSQGCRVAELGGRRTGRFPTLSCDKGDTGHKGIQMRRGSLAKLAIQENFGKLSTSPLRAGQTSLWGLPRGSRLRQSAGLPASQPDTRPRGHSAQAQHVTANPGASPRGGLYVRERGPTGASAFDEGKTLKLGDKTMSPHPDKPGGLSYKATDLQVCTITKQKIPLLTKAKQISSHWLLSVWGEFCAHR